MPKVWIATDLMSKEKHIVNGHGLLCDTTICVSYLIPGVTDFEYVTCTVFFEK